MTIVKTPIKTRFDFSAIDIASNVVIISITKLLPLIERVFHY
ncbi:hypothetical protein [Metabacillus bambusae]|nr:hypothetical protein [Metabacillus bambusae]